MRHEDRETARVAARVWLSFCSRLLRTAWFQRRYELARWRLLRRVALSAVARREWAAVGAAHAARRARAGAQYPLCVLRVRIHLHRGGSCLLQRQNRGGQTRLCDRSCRGRRAADTLGVAFIFRVCELQQHRTIRDLCQLDAIPADDLLQHRNPLCYLTGGSTTTEAWPTSGGRRYSSLPHAHPFTGRLLCMVGHSHPGAAPVQHVRGWCSLRSRSTRAPDADGTCACPVRTGLLGQPQTGDRADRNDWSVRYTTFAPIRHVLELRAFNPALIDRIGTADGNLVLVEISPHRDMDSHPSRRTPTTPFDVHFEGLLPGIAGQRFYSQMIDGWAWTVFGARLSVLARYMAALSPRHPSMRSSTKCAVGSTAPVRVD